MLMSGGKGTAIAVPVTLNSSQIARNTTGSIGKNASVAIPVTFRGLLTSIKKIGVWHRYKYIVCFLGLNFKIVLGLLF